MSTFTIRVTSSATNVAGTAYGQQPDLGAPSFFDMVVSGSTDPLIPNGVYDAYCLNPQTNIYLSPTTYQAQNYAGNDAASFTPIGFGAMTQAQVDQVNWILAQNFTSDPKYAGQFNYGEVQTAIWKTVGFTDAQIAAEGFDRYLNDNNRTVVNTDDINFILTAAQAAIASGNGVVPTDSFFSTVIDPSGNVQPLIVQLQSAKLGNYVWADTDADGIQDAGEAGVDNVIVELYDGNGVLLASTVTGDDFSTAAVEQGYYQFTGLKAGDYQVKFVAPTGQVLTSQDANGNTQDAADSDANVATGFSQVVTLAVGESNQTIDAGLVPAQVPPASLGDYVWLDNNNDGQQNDGNTGVNGVTVNLYKADGTFVATTQTADKAGTPGYYLFADLIPGDYKVEFIAPAGYALAKQDLGNDASDSDANLNGMTIVTTLTSGENDLSWDAGLVKLASLGDRVWEDSNANGVQDNGESGIGNVTVYLKDCATNALLDTTTTDANGNYSFSGLMPGVYHVEFVAPNGYVYSAQDVTAENLGTDSDANSAGITACYTVNSGDTITTVDAGLYQTASLGDYVWLDNNNDGQQNDGNTGVNGVTVNLYKADGTFVATTQTADKAGTPGYYLFANLIPGDYKVEFIAPTGYALAKQDQGSDASDSDADLNGMTVVTTLTSGENDLSWDAGLVKLASLGDRVWEDSNANGVQDNGETGIGNVTVYLKDCATNALLDTTTTDANGNYSFSGLMPGVYHVEFVAPNGYVYSAQDVTAEAAGTDSDANSAGITACYTVNSGDVINTVDAGMYQTASLGDYVWLDNNNDGQQNDGNTGMNGVTVNLYKADGSFVASTVTADKAGTPGYYLFADLIPGDYKVEFIAPAGYALAKQDQGSDASDSDADSNGMTIVTTLTSGENDLSWDAGLVKLASLGDRVWEDSNANGVQDNGESGIGNVTVYLKDCATNALLDTTTTDVNGNYSFSGLMPGVYHVEFVAPNGYVYSAQDVTAEAAGTDSDANSAGITACYTVNSGDVITTVDAGLYQTASLGDYVWLDNNNDGQQNDGNTGVNGVTVNLYKADGSFVASTVTADKAGTPGYYQFADLIPGDYKVEFIAPAGYALAKQDQGSDASDSDADQTTGMTIVTTLTSGENDLSWDAGLVKLASLGDRVWEDSNANGVQDNGETGIGNVTVKLYDCNTNQQIGTTTTDTNGNYHFSGLMPGVYHVEFVAPNGYVYSAQDVTAEAAGTDSDANSAGITACYSVNSGDVIDTVDAGLYQKASIGDRVWYDDNGNGIQDAGEAGVANVVVELRTNVAGGAGGTVLATTTTDANGNYLFDNLTPGEYHIDIQEWSLPSGYQFTTPDQGNNDGLDSDVVNTASIPLTWGVMENTTLTSGENDMSWDAGIVKLASIGDRVWEDSNANGVQDNGENGISGVTVNLLNAAGAVIGTTTTNASGNYLFSALMPGDYAVQVVAPNGYTVTGKDLGGNDVTDSDIDATTGKTIVTTLTSGENDMTWDAGLYQKASIGDRVWLDKNANGVQDNGEVGLQGVTVNLLNAAGSVVATATTNASGNYLFSNLVPGDYAIQVVAPNGYFVSGKDLGGNDATDSDIDTATGKTILTTLTSGENDMSWDGGLYQKASIGDRVWLDSNANGVQDSGENGISGVTVNLLNAAGAVIGTTTTNASGNYLFGSLNPGDYAVQVVAPSGYLVSPKDAAGNDATDSDIDATTGKTIVTTLDSGENDMSWDAGLYVPAKASIGDKVWLDCDADGVQDANEIGVAGVTVKLLNSAGTVLATTTTDYQGNYLFENLTAGDYSIQVVAPTGYSFTAKDQGGNDALDSDADAATGKMIVTTLSAGENDMSWDAGLTTVGACLDLELTGGSNSGECVGNIRTYTMNGLSVHASAFSRTDTGGGWATAYLASYSGGLGVTDTSEDGSTPNHAIDNVGGRDNYILLEFNKTVLLDKAFLGWVSGDSDIQVWIGNFNNPYNGHLTLSDSVLTSMGFMELNSTTLTTTRWADLNAGDYAGNTIVIAADTADTSPEDFFKLQTLSICTPSCGLTASIGDKVWLDCDNDGVQDSGEAGVAGVTVKLLDAAGTVLSTTTTDASGNYLFSNLAAGDYAIQVVAPTGYAFTGKDLGGNDATDSDVDTGTGKTIVTSLTGGENDMSWDAGLKLVPTKASIGDKVWHDANFDGVQNSYEVGIANVTVKLLNSAGTVVATTTTNSVGEYLFSNLTPGDYKIQVVKPSGYYTTKKDATYDSLDSDVDSNGYSVLTTLSAGENDMNWDAGLYKKASIGDKVWEDKDHDDIQDSTEPGIGNVKVMLQNSSGVTIATTYTNSSGNYKFTNLDPGTYRLVFDKTNTTYNGISMTKWKWASKNIGSNDSIDSDVNGDGVSLHNVAYTDYTTLTSGENDMTWDAAITPIVIDLNGNGIQTVARANSTGTFDLLGSGTAIDSGWLSGDDGFLAVDKNGNGKIDDIGELFGGLGKGDGFAKLASFDSNGDGVVNADDADFASLKIWQDINGNHQTDAGELMGLLDAGVASLTVAYTEVPFVDANGNLHLERSSATLADGSSVDMTDVYFNVAAEDAAAAGVDVASLGQLLGDDSGLDGLLAGLGGGVGMAISAASDMSANADVFDTAGLDAMKQMAALYEEQAAACCA